MVFDQSARVAAVAQKEHEQIFSKPGWVEHDSLEIQRRTEEVIAEALEQRGLRASDLAAIGITNQRETTVLWERKTGKPVANAIVWQDTRVAEDVASFAREGGQDRYVQTERNVASPEGNPQGISSDRPRRRRRFTYPQSCAQPANTARSCARAWDSLAGLAGNCKTVAS